MLNYRTTILNVGRNYSLYSCAQAAVDDDGVHIRIVALKRCHAFLGMPDGWPIDYSHMESVTVARRKGYKSTLIVLREPHDKGLIVMSRWVGDQILEQTTQERPAERYLDNNRTADSSDTGESTR